MAGIARLQTACPTEEAEAVDDARLRFRAGSSETARGSITTNKRYIRNKFMSMPRLSGMECTVNIYSCMHALTADLWPISPHQRLPEPEPAEVLPQIVKQYWSLCVLNVCSPSLQAYTQH